MMNQQANPKRFFIGIALIIGSSAYGWAGLLGFNALALIYGVSWALLGLIIYGISWITFGIGIILAGRSGLLYAKEIVKKFFKREK